jgi:twitching motility protein PilT
LAAAGTAPIHITLDPNSGGSATDELLTAMLRANPRISDLIFSPGRKPQVQANGAFLSVEVPGMALLSADDTRRIGAHLIGSNKAAINVLREQGYCDVSYALPGVARFRVNVFIQRGSCAIVMRVIPTRVPELEAIGAPEQLQKITQLHDGLVLITGPRGSGKSSTLAAVIDHINESSACHIITIEDPIEFLFMHKQATVHQRELHSDTPSISHAMRAALRQAPNVIVVGELKERETMELALDAAETGHLVLATLNTLNARKAVERFLGAFAVSEQPAIRERLSRMLRMVVAQRLIPRVDGERMAVFEVIDSAASFPGLDDPGEAARATHGLDQELERLLNAGIISAEIAAANASSPSSLLKKPSQKSRVR